MKIDISRDSKKKIILNEFLEPFQFTDKQLSIIQRGMKEGTHSIIMAENGLRAIIKNPQKIYSDYYGDIKKVLHLLTILPDLYVDIQYKNIIYCYVLLFHKNILSYQVFFQ